MHGDLIPCTGASRGFAFVEFQNTDDALRWMESNQVLKMLHYLCVNTTTLSAPRRTADYMSKRMGGESYISLR